MIVQNAVQPSLLPGPNCERCGRCLSVCPVYRHSRVETLSPRGRFEVLDGLAAGQLAPGGRAAESLDTCLQCRACSDICGKGVDVAGLVRAHRADAPASTVGSALARALVGIGFGLVMAHRPVLAGLATALGFFSRLLPSRGTPPVRHLPLALPQVLRGRAVPTVAGPGLFRRYPERVAPRPGVRGRGPAIFFAGCWQAALEPGPAVAAVELLRAAGFTVLLPRDQTCCGFPALASGHAEHAGRLARRNRDVLAGLHTGAPVFASCPACRTGLELAGVTDRDILDPLAVLAGAGAYAPCGTRPAQDVTVAVHEPCHARGSLPATLALLSLIPGVTAVPLGEQSCCGGGGLSALSNPELSWPLGRSRAALAAATGASVVAAACPGCLNHLRGSLARSDIPVRCVHPLELLAATLPRG